MSATLRLQTLGICVAVASAAGARAQPTLHASRAPATPVPAILVPFHGTQDRLAFGGHGELRLGHDRVAGVADPEWFSVGRVSGFARAGLGARVELAGAAAWDPGTDDFVLERAELGVLVRRSLQAHAGIFLLPLGRTNLEHDAPRNEFAERSLVATQLIGVPHAQLGAGIRGLGPTGASWTLAYEVDLVTGYDDGLLVDASGGTRLPSGRNNYADNNDIPGLAARLALHSAAGTELGLAALRNRYNQTDLGGVAVDEPRSVQLVVADAAAQLAGFGVSGEAALALIDVPPGLETLFASEQWGAALEAARVLRAPLFDAWKFSSLALAVRADAVDFDRATDGDSRSRIGLSLNVRRVPFVVTRFGWYYEIRRDRFANSTPLAGLALSLASYF